MHSSSLVSMNPQQHHSTSSLSKERETRNTRHMDPSSTPMKLTSVGPGMTKHSYSLPLLPTACPPCTEEDTCAASSRSPSSMGTSEKRKKPKGTVVSKHVDGRIESSLEPFLPPASMDHSSASCGTAPSFTTSIPQQGEIVKNNGEGQDHTKREVPETTDEEVGSEEGEEQSTTSPNYSSTTSSMTSTMGTNTSLEISSSGFCSQDGGREGVQGEQEEVLSSTPRSTNVEVPLITPRYQRRHRILRRMNVTDSTPSVQKTSSLLSNRTTECMTIQQGKLAYTEKVHFQTYDLFRHGKGKIHTRSVGYSEEGDLVMFREDLSEAAGDVQPAVRRTAMIYNATVLDPSAQAPTSPDSAPPPHVSHRSKKKYPGIRVPRNKKIRNRLQNDFFASDEAKPILDQAREFEKEEERERGKNEDKFATKPIFCPLPHPLDLTFDVPDENGGSVAEKFWSPPQKPPPTPIDPNSPEARLQLLNTRLRAEVQRALSSEFLSQQMEDLEANFTLFICSGSSSTTSDASSTGNATKKSLVFNFQNGYSRLICHGIATYYGLVSQSIVVNGVSGSKNGKENTSFSTLTHPHPFSSSTAPSNIKSTPPPFAMGSPRDGGRGGGKDASVKLTFVSFPQLSKKRKKVAKHVTMKGGEPTLELPQVPLIQCLRPCSFPRQGYSSSSFTSSSPFLGPISGGGSNSSCSSLCFLPEEHSSCLSCIEEKGRKEGSATRPPSAKRENEKEGERSSREICCNAGEVTNAEEVAPPSPCVQDAKRKEGTRVGDNANEESRDVRTPRVPFPPSCCVLPRGTPLGSWNRLGTSSGHTEGPDERPPPSPLPYHRPNEFMTAVAASSHWDTGSASTPPLGSNGEGAVLGGPSSCVLSYNTTLRVAQVGGGGDSLGITDIPPLYEPQLCLVRNHPRTPSFSYSPCSPALPPFVLPPPATPMTTSTALNSAREESSRNQATSTFTMTNVNSVAPLLDGVSTSVTIPSQRDAPMGGYEVNEDEEENTAGAEKKEEDAVAGSFSRFSVKERMTIQERLAALGLQIRPLAVNGGKTTLQCM